MPPVVIDNPILNSPFAEPSRHFRFSEDGITDQAVDGRRESGYFLPIASPRKKGGQLRFETEWTQDRFQSSPRINRIRERVALWRRGGYVGCTRVPHVTLKSIANNPDIKQGMSRETIDAAIMRHADTELLHDKPYEDNKRIRVTGPFTVESLSPHRVLSTDQDRPRSEREGQRDVSTASFETMILDNLRKAGVQNTKKNERLAFDRLEPHAGSWVHATGTYTDADGKSRRVAVSIGPEHGTVGPQQVKEAAKEAVQGVGHDVLLVCGFAFDPHVSEEAKRYGQLQVLTTREPGSLDGRRAAQEDGRRQSLHGLRRAGRHRLD